jgi:hypothetical protein
MMMTYALYTLKRRYLQLPLQAVPITTEVVSSHPVHGEVHSIQHYVIKFVNDLWQVFSGYSSFVH